MENGRGIENMMTGLELRRLGQRALLGDKQNEKDYETLADGILELYAAGDPQFREHIKNRSKRVTESTGVAFAAGKFERAMARAFVADEIGFNSWDDLIEAVRGSDARPRPIVFEYTKAAMWRGDFTSLEQTLGADAFDDTIIDWFGKGYFEGEAETLNEIFAASCMLGHPRLAEFLLDKGVDPYAGMRTGLAGFHYAASSGRLDVIKLLIERRVPMEVKNMYGGTVFGQAIWSAVNEWTPDHAEIVEELVKAGAIVDDGYIEWWDEQEVPDAETKRRIANVLNEHRDFHSRLGSAKEQVDEAEHGGSQKTIADTLKALGNILRRPPFLREAANEAYTRSAALYRELGMPLEEAWVKRHIGINHEYAGRLVEAEKYYDEALSLYREHSTDDLNYANAVRYPAVIKERLGNKDEAARLWEEAHDRYREIGPGGLGEGVAEAAAWLTIFAIEKGDRDLAQNWFARASEASAASEDPDTHKFIAEVKATLEKGSQVL